MSNIIGKAYTFGDRYIKFLDYNNVMTGWGAGTYKAINDYVYEATWANYVHIIHFNSFYDEYVSVRRGDLDCIKGNLNISLAEFLNSRGIYTFKDKCILQIGAHVGNTSNDPIFKGIDSTTKLILVEPVPYLFRKLQENYKTKLNTIDNIVFINKAVSDFIGDINLTVPSETNDFSMLPDWVTQLASVNSNHAKDHIPSDSRLNNLIMDTIKVKTTTIDEIVSNYALNNIYLLHVDTEGHDYTILMNYSFTIKPKFILFEHKHIDGSFTIGDKYNTLSNKLISLGYKKLYKELEDTMFELC
jgi:FkbM family methyltransferase